jgi:hypothetical protein
MEYKRKRQTNQQKQQRIRERAEDYHLPLLPPFESKPKDWWSGVIDDYIEATKCDSTDQGR